MNQRRSELVTMETEVRLDISGSNLVLIVTLFSLGTGSFQPINQIFNSYCICFNLRSLIATLRNGSHAHFS